MAIQKSLQVRAEIATERAGKSLAAGDISPSLHARIIDGTVSKRDIAEATNALKNAREDFKTVLRDTSKSAELEQERVSDSIDNYKSLRDALVDQYRDQPTWRSMLENIKDSAAKWGAQAKKDFLEVNADPGRVLRNIR